MLQRADIVGHRITEILGNSSLSDESINFCDFLYRTDNGRCFRMPFDDESGDLMPTVDLTDSYSPVIWPREKQTHYQQKLWKATIVDVLVPADPEERYPDSGVVALSSGWFIMQYSSAPIGIMPFVDLILETPGEQPMVSVWETG